MKLYIVATPIGNLDDISKRAVETLSDVDFIYCEDTRQTKKLADHYEIKTRLRSYHQHSDQKVINEISELLRQEKDIAYVSDAGTPGISDPGGKLVADLIADLGEELEVIPIPGPAAVIAALSVSGYSTDSFQFLGFIPHKKGRQKFLHKVKAREMTTVFYESVHRIEKLLGQMNELIPEQELMIGRELTKQFETIYRGNPQDILEKLKQDKIKGEFVVVVPK